MTPNQQSNLDLPPARPSVWRLLAVPAVAALFAFGVALALPSAPSADSTPTVSQACLEAEVSLPPGHPPIGGGAMTPRGYEALLPPGHPPISGSRAQRAAPPLRAPGFSPPEIHDI